VKRIAEAFNCLCGHSKRGIREGRALKIFYKVCTEFNVVQVNRILEPEILDIARRKPRGTPGEGTRIFKRTRISIRKWWLGRVEVIAVIVRVIAIRPRCDVRWSLVLCCTRLCQCPKRSGCGSSIILQ
jgi:hypothetical protein